VFYDLINAVLTASIQTTYKHLKLGEVHRKNDHSVKIQTADGVTVYGDVGTYLLVEQGEAVHRLADVFVYPHPVDEHGRTRLNMDKASRCATLVFAHQLVSKVTLAAQVTKRGRAFLEDYSDVFAVPTGIIARAKDVIFLQRHNMLQAGLGSTSQTVRDFFHEEANTPFKVRYGPYLPP